MTSKIESSTDIINKPSYRNILLVLMDAHTRKKRIAFKHLKYLLVTGADKKLSPEEWKKIFEIFRYDKPEFIPGRGGRVREAWSILDYLDDSGEITSISNLGNKLEVLLYYKMIKQNGRFYDVTKWCCIHVRRYIIEQDFRNMMDYIYSTKRPINKSMNILDVLERNIDNFTISVIKNDKERA
jgi:hypothetical protein